MSAEDFLSSRIWPDLAPKIAGLLTEHRHKSVRIQSRLIAELVASQPPPDTSSPVTLPDKHPPDPEAWTEFRERLQHDPIGALVDYGVATTRRQTTEAMRVLGLDPNEVCAVVIEQGALRVYRYDTDRPNIPQTVPILEESA